jgi:hypothetical protein
MTACASGGAGNLGGDDEDAEAGTPLDATTNDAPGDAHHAPEATPPSGDSGGDAPGAETSAPTDTGAPPDSTPSDGDGSPGDAPSAGDAPGDGPSRTDAPTTSDLAPSGSGYTWQSMTSSSANTGRQSAPAVNDGKTSTQANIDSSSGDSMNAWEGAGVVFSSAHGVASVTFVQGLTMTASDGWFEANLKLQFSSDGTTWTDSSWSCTPAYGYSNAVSGKSYVFQGTTPASGVLGVRVVGQVNTLGNSWWAAVSEIEVFGS